jgi:transcriptional regulator with XRE-family HTH domain
MNVVKLARDTRTYNEFGKYLDQLCLEQGISFSRLAGEAGMKSHASIVRAAQGKSKPTREHLLSWCQILGCSPEQQARLLHPFGYATPEELGDENIKERFSSHKTLS